MSAKNSRHARMSKRWLWLMLAFLVIGLMGANSVGGAGGTAGGHGHWGPFSFLGGEYTTFEKVALLANVFIALLGLGYALFLVKEVYGADTGTPRMQEIAKAVREGADAYLTRQLTTVGILILFITVVLVA